MTPAVTIRLATYADADAIALLSRSEIEYELPWSWTPSRVRQAIASLSTNVAVAHDDGKLVAFGIMSYRDDVARLLLLAVHPSVRRRGIGSLVLRWLEKVAHVAGIARIRLEARQENVAADCLLSQARIPGAWNSCRNVRWDGERGPLGEGHRGRGGDAMIPVAPRLAATVQDQPVNNRATHCVDAMINDGEPSRRADALRSAPHALDQEPGLGSRLDPECSLVSPAGPSAGARL